MVGQALNSVDGTAHSVVQCGRPVLAKFTGGWVEEEMQGDERKKEGANKSR